ANPQSYNRYSYVLNRSLSFTDPIGHKECDLQNGCGGGAAPPPTQPPSPPPAPPPPMSQSPNEPSCTDIWCLSESSSGNTLTPINLETWEARLLILVAIYEGGAQSVQQVQYITWTILNRYNNQNIRTHSAYDSRMESILLSDPGQYHVAFGDPRKGFPGGIFNGTLAGTGPVGQELVTTIYEGSSNPYLNSVNIQAVNGVVAAYNSGAADPTNGADSFYHVAAGQGEASSQAKSNLAAGQIAGWLPGNGLVPPYGLSMDMVYWRQYP
ncbi:MAG: hypothetical protein KF770_32520, partial [Anaerolineae bacterium]|nr:hypothetical protein [Anaerolineae bacterium]